MQSVKNNKESKKIHSALRSAFWSGSLSEKKWRRVIRDHSMSHKAILKTSFEHMPASFLVNEIGKKGFAKRWPVIRKLFDPNNANEQKRILLFDSIWGIITTGDSQYPVSGKIVSLSKGRLLLLQETVNCPGLSIYALSRKVGRDYSRVFKDIKTLVSQNLVDIKEDLVQGRKISKLFSRESINTKLVPGQDYTGQLSNSAA